MPAKTARVKEFLAKEMPVHPTPPVSSPLPSAQHNRGRPDSDAGAASAPERQIYINTLMLKKALARLGARDLRAMTPLIWEHVTPYGRIELDMNARLPLDWLKRRLATRLLGLPLVRRTQPIRLLIRRVRTAIGAKLADFDPVDQEKARRVRFLFQFSVPMLFTGLPLLLNPQPGEIPVEDLRGDRRHIGAALDRG
jgi:hypothetical protein